jgi:hypothetical protein
MRPRLLVRILIGASLAIAATIGSLAMAQTAGAVNYTSCSSLSGLNLSGQTITVSGCTGPTGGSGVTSGPLTSPMTLSWAGGGTTMVSFTTKVHGKSKCAAGSTEMSLHGHATASTGPAESIRGMFYATVCIDPNENLSLLTGKDVLLETR